jgi:hypothetical protein
MADNDNGTFSLALAMRPCSEPRFPGACSRRRRGPRHRPLDAPEEVHSRCRQDRAEERRSRRLVQHFANACRRHSRRRSYRPHAPLIHAMRGDSWHAVADREIAPNFPTGAAVRRVSQIHLTKGR